MGTPPALRAAWFPMEQLLAILLVKLAAAASIASILARSARFLNLLMREERSLFEQLQIGAGVSAVCAAGSTVRIFTRSYSAFDIALEGSMVSGIVGGYLTGLITGVVSSLPAVLAGEYMAMPLYAAAGVAGGLLRDLAPGPEDVWRFSPFFDLSIWRLIRYPATRRRSAYHLAVLISILITEMLRSIVSELFGGRAIFALAGPPGPLANVAIFVTTVYTVSIPIKVWNSARTERLLEVKERLLVEARLAALSKQINPHFLFNTLNTVSSLVRTNPEQARRVVVKLATILRRLLRKTGNFAPLREELQFIEDYLSIEMVRFGDKLEFRKEIEEATLNCQVPSMLLQPLIENSIKHGLAPKVEGGRITVHSKLVGGAGYAARKRLLLAVEDDGVGIGEDRLPRLFAEPGIGVSNVNERLQVLFGGDCRLEVNSQPGGGTRTEIEIPAG
jgi:two-component system LytT family sensor kinase